MRELIESYIYVLKDWHNMKGKLELRPYLLFVLTTLLIMVAMIWTAKAWDPFWSIFKIFSVIMLVPFFTATVRRLHYVNKSALHLLTLMIPVIGLIWVCLHLFQEEPDAAGYDIKQQVKNALTPDTRHLEKKKQQQNETE